MPPPESNLTLTNKEKETLKKWIEQGAKWKSHWSYSKPILPEIPKTDFSNWCSNEIDFFIANKLESKGLKPSEIEEKEIDLKNEAELLLEDNNEATAQATLKASAKAKLIAGEALTEAEADTIVL